MRIYFCLLVLIFSNVSTKAIVEDKTDLKIMATEQPSDSDSQELMLNQISISEGHSRQKRAPEQKNHNQNRHIKASINVKNRGHAGHDVGAKADGAWHSRDGRSSLNFNANFDQFFGRGKSKPIFDADIKFNHIFD